jgi:hypothetical protein
MAMIDKEKFARCLRDAQKVTGITVTPESAVVLVPVAEDIRESICGFRIMYAHVSSITFAFNNWQMGKTIREFEDIW